MASLKHFFHPDNFGLWRWIETGGLLIFLTGLFTHALPFAFIGIGLLAVGFACERTEKKP